MRTLIDSHVFVWWRAVEQLYPIHGPVGREIDVDLVAEPNGFDVHARCVAKPQIRDVALRIVGQPHPRLRGRSFQKYFTMVLMTSQSSSSYTANTSICLFA